MPNLRGRNSKRSGRDRKVESDEEFDFGTVGEAEDGYGGSNQRNEPKPERTKQGRDKAKKAKTKTWSKAYRKTNQRQPIR